MKEVNEQKISSLIDTMVMYYDNLEFTENEEYELFYRKEIRRNYKLLLLELENFDYCPNMELITKLANAKFISDENERLIKEKK